MIISAANGQNSVGAMSTWIVLSMILLPIVLVIAAVDYNKYKNTR